MRDLERSTWIDSSSGDFDQIDIINRQNGDDLQGTINTNRTAGTGTEFEIVASHFQRNESMSWSTSTQSQDPNPSHRGPMSDLD